MIDRLDLLARLHPLAPVRRREAGRHEVALQVDVDDVVPLLLRHRHEHAVAQDAGVVDQHVEVAEGVDRGADQRLAAVPARDVVVRRDGLAAGGADLLGGLLRDLAEVVDDDLGALGREQARVLAPEAAAGAGDDRDPAVECPHAGHRSGSYRRR